jgi:hypothetical protein
MPAEAATAALAAAGVKDSATCEGRRACLAGLGRQLGLRAVVGVDVGRVLDQYAVTLEAVEVATETRLARRSFLVKVSAWPNGALPELETFATEYKAALAARPPPADAPTVAKLDPPPPPPPPLVLEAPEPKRWPRITLLVAAGAGTAASIGLAAAGFAERDVLKAAERDSPWGPASTLTRAQADALAARSNALLTASLICAITSAVLAAAGFTVWALE